MKCFFGSILREKIILALVCWDQGWNSFSVDSPQVEISTADVDLHLSLVWTAGSLLLQLFKCFLHNENGQDLGPL